MLNMDSKRWALISWIAVSTILLSVLAYQSLLHPMRIDADLVSLLDMDDQLGDITELATQPYQNKALILLSGSEPEQVKKQLFDIQSQLTFLNEIELVSSNPGNHIDIAELISPYLQYPLSFLSKQANRARLNSDFGYITQRFMGFMSQPTNPLVTTTIEDAPMLNLADWLSDRLHQNDWQQDGDLLFVTGKNQNKMLRYYPLFIEFTPTASKLDRAVEVIQQFNNVITSAIHNSDTQVLKSGFIFHTAATTDRAEFEMQLFGGLSVLGVILLSLIYFRSVRPILWILFLIGNATLAGMAALSIVYSELHILTLVFAISLIGIAVDYGYHVILSARFTGKSGKKLIQYIAPALLLGGATTLLSYLLLLLLPIPFLRQVAVFVCAGLGYAMFTCISVLVWRSSTPAVQEKNSQTTHTFQISFNANRYHLLTLSLLTICLLAVSQWHFEDNIKQFNSTPQSLIDDEIKVSQLIGNMQYPRFIVLSATSAELLLQRMEELRIAFSEQTLPDNELSALDLWLPSIKTQQTNRLWLTQGVEQGEFTDILALVGEQRSHKQLTKSGFMTVTQLPEQIAAMYPPIHKSGQDYYGVMNYLGPLSKSDMSKLNQALDFQIHLIDQPQELSMALTKLREYIMYFIGLSIIALILIMMTRYGWLAGLNTALVPILSAMSGLALTQLILGYVSLFNLLACILVLALTVDYTVFWKEHGPCSHVIHAIGLSAVTSCLAFGMLVLSSTPAIWQFGLTVLFGVSFGWGLCMLSPSSATKDVNA